MHVGYIFWGEWCFTLGIKQLIHMFCEVISKEKNSDVGALSREAHDSYEQGDDLKEDRNEERGLGVSLGQEEDDSGEWAETTPFRSVSWFSAPPLCVHDSINHSGCRKAHSRKISMVN